MPEYTYDDRKMIEVEVSLWNAEFILNVGAAGAWTDRIRAVREQVSSIAKEIKDHNDQFET